MLNGETNIVTCISVKSLVQKNKNYYLTSLEELEISVVANIYDRNVIKYGMLVSNMSNSLSAVI